MDKPKENFDIKQNLTMILLQVVIVAGSEWAGTRDLFRACVSSAARALTPHAAAKPDLAEGLFTLLVAITKKKPQYLDWIDDLLSDLVELGIVVVVLLVTL